MQSELFGVVKGAFTDATTSRDGLIKAAEGGTLLLDEIGEMPLASQANLLRFLEDRLVTPVGGHQNTRVDVSVIASTNRDLHAEAREGRFRRDLLYRLEVLPIGTPPLRARTSDIEALVYHFLQTAAGTLPHRLLGLTSEALDWLRAQPWPGNVRQLKSCIIQAGIHCRGDEITADDLRRLPLMGNSLQSLTDVTTSTQKATVERLLAQNRGNVAQTARDLKVSRMTLYRLMTKHDIARA
jgi:DNA-binding NtrC family response regulator